MKKSCLTAFLAITAILFFPLKGRTQDHENIILINLGLSSGTGYPSGLTEQNSGISTANFDGEYFLNKLFSVGVYGAYTNDYYKHDFPQVGYKNVWKGWDVGLRGTFHASPLFIKNKRADLYVAAFSGYTSRVLVYDGSNIYRETLSYHENAFSVGGILGFRYAFTRCFGFYGEAGMARKFFMGGGVSFSINKRKPDLTGNK